ncbi:adenylate kinase [Kribbella sp.]|uniref:adenylate kinase n=1 Tax=Kribbella sp. TaxID=1871183 RepID=UPI002D22163E|nr:adenylate kinase [Kribbella sp.]HZX02821.1 adenylate kinase [Kribbella sp.]
MTFLVLMGPPGAGKSTQAKVLAERLGVPAISTGDIFRAHVAEGTELGREAQRYLDAGEYVPDEVTNAMVRERLGADDAQSGFVLDGYPRTLEQVAVLDGLFAEVDGGLDAVVVLEVDLDELVQRLLHRAELEHRTDDTEDVVRRRLQVYAEQTDPVIEVYRERGLVIPVDGTGGVSEVSRRILQVADALLRRNR